MTKKATMSGAREHPLPSHPRTKTPDAKPEWYPVDDKGHYERVCTCRKEVSDPPLWSARHYRDPDVMQHEASCSIADKPELLKLAVKVKKESTYDFATCGVCSRNWYAFDRPSVEAQR
ncbi:MAG TPA: hypothetical protein VF148_06470 [Acidimicrobiia bacterium]